MALFFSRVKNMIINEEEVRDTQAVELGLNLPCGVRCSHMASFFCHRDINMDIYEEEVLTNV